MYEINEGCRVSHNSKDFYCRYMNIDLPLFPRSATYTGKFGQELIKLGMDSFPFRIHPVDLVLHGVLKPSLYVGLPQSYFDTWKNFPVRPRESEIDDSMAGMYDCHISPIFAKSIVDLLHPYDGELKRPFREKFQSEIPEKFTECTHPNRGKYISAEAYIAYWQAYAIADGFYKYRHAEFFLSSHDGKRQCIEMAKSKAKSFIEKYGDAFDRLSWYRTIVTGVNFSALSCSCGDVFAFAQRYSKVNNDSLRKDLRLLLELDAKWKFQVKKHGCVVLKNARNSLSKDIYLVYEQLRLLDVPANAIFEEFSPAYFGAVFTPLSEVLQFEEYVLKQSFLSLGKFYCAEIKAREYECSDQVFDALMQVPGFDTWMRAFHDLHESLNEPKEQPVSFKQNRIVDALIIMSVRTEIVLRELFRPVLDSESDLSIIDFLKAAKAHLTDKKLKIVDEVCSAKNAKKTKLHNTPPDIFIGIDDMAFSKWSKQDVCLFRAIMKFIAARNYFAHHAYKDDEINIQASALSKQILESLFATLLFFQKHKKT